MARMQLLAVLSVVCAAQCLLISNDELEDFEDYIKRTSQLSPILKKGVEADEHDEIDVVSDNAWEQSGKFEGDLILNDRQRRLIVENVAEGLSRNGLRDGTKRWPDGEVVFYIQVEHFNHDQVQAILQGMEDLARVSCIKFRKYKKGDRDAVVIQGSRPGCFSQVGYQGGYQVLNLSGRHPVGRGCFRHGTVVHEMLHTLGFYHMQSSSERDDYVAIQWGNIVQRARNNFRKYNSFSVSNFGIGYDYDSVMHYGRRAFSVNGKDTIVPKKAGADIGQRVGLSTKDVQKLNRMYCDADADADPTPADKNTASKKKTGKNKPMDIYGLGYHQGNAVVIKVLPQTQQRKIPEMHTSYVFDYFSKTPHLLPSSKKEDLWVGKDIAEFYKPFEPTNSQIYKLPVNTTGYEKHTHEREIEAPKQEHDYFTKSEYVKDTRSDEMPGKLITEEVETDPALFEPFDRLSKIIKSHVYPSQDPDLSIYRMNKENIEYDHNSQKDRKENVAIPVPAASLADRMSQAEKMKSAMQFINNLYDSNDHSNLNPETSSRGYHEDHGNINIKQALFMIDELPNKKAKGRQNINLSRNRPNLEHDSDYHPVPHHKPIRGHDSVDKYHSKERDIDTYDDDHDDWHHKYTPYKFNGDHSKDYIKHSIDNDDYYSPAEPVRIEEYIFSSPFESDKHNNVKNREER